MPKPVRNKPNGGRILEKIPKLDDEIYLKPGPGHYNIADAYKEIYSSNRGYNLKGCSGRRNLVRSKVPGAGTYNVHSSFDKFSKQSFIQRKKTQQKAREKRMILRKQ